MKKKISPRNFRSFVISLVALFVALISVTFSSGNDTASVSHYDGRAPEKFSFVRGIDGDTIVVKVDGVEEKVRLIGVNTPELSRYGRPTECFAQEAKERVSDMLSQGKIILKADPTQGDRDKYQRLLRYVYLEDGTLLNRHLVAEGFGFEYTYKKPYQFQSEFRRLEKTAEQKGFGLWGDEACDTQRNYPHHS